MTIRWSLNSCVAMLLFGLYGTSYSDWVNQLADENLPEPPPTVRTRLLTWAMRQCSSDMTRLLQEVGGSIGVTSPCCGAPSKTAYVGDANRFDVYRCVQCGREFTPGQALEERGLECRCGGRLMIQELAPEQFRLSCPQCGSQSTIGGGSSGGGV
jgi:DNA-directed RNA polymerase subunit RPC12/RpoP